MHLQNFLNGCLGFNLKFTFTSSVHTVVKQRIVELCLAYRCFLNTVSAIRKPFQMLTVPCNNLIISLVINM